MRGFGKSVVGGMSAEAGENGATSDGGIYAGEENSKG